MPSPALASLSYASRALIAPGPELDALAERARSANVALGVTGALYGDGSVFYQVLEGEAGVLDALFARIARDPRHCDVRLYGVRLVPRRRFRGWALKVVAPRDPCRLDGLFSDGALLEAANVDLDARAAALRAA